MNSSRDQAHTTNFWWEIPVETNYQKRKCQMLHKETHQVPTNLKHVTFAVLAYNNSLSEGLLAYYDYNRDGSYLYLAWGHLHGTGICPGLEYHGSQHQGG